MEFFDLIPSSPTYTPEGLFLPESYCTTVYISAGFIFMSLELRYVSLNKVVQIFSAKIIRTVPRKAAFLSLSLSRLEKD